MNCPTCVDWKGAIIQYVMTSESTNVRKGPKLAKITVFYMLWRSTQHIRSTIAAPLQRTWEMKRMSE